MNFMGQVLKIGTRRSKLAQVQSHLVADMIQQHFPDITVELVGIETEGDQSQIHNKPLWQLEGKDFWVKEIDEALRDGRTDISVHSMKDLSLTRPDFIHMGAVPTRENPSDVVVFGPRILEKLKKGEDIILGTSAPRRLENTPRFLKQALPQLGGGAPKIKPVPVRGNVDSRLSRLHEDPASDRYMDGVVLAFGGINRLWAGDQLNGLLKNTRVMYLPLSECPGAPGQGAMAVECRVDDQKTRDILSRIQCEDTMRHVRAERAVLAEFGGGCHQKFGASSVYLENLQKDLLFVRGLDPKDKPVDEIRWDMPPKPENPMAWDGTQWRQSILTEEQIAPTHTNFSDRLLFLTHSRALSNLDVKLFDAARVWTAGVNSWFRLAAQGLWVEGCADGLGVEEMARQVDRSFLDVPPMKDWLILTHQGAVDTWPAGEVMASYEVCAQDHPAAMEALKQATYIYWSSSSQYDVLKDYVRDDAHHACGSGKTVGLLRQLGVKNLQAFPCVEEWRKWMGMHEQVSEKFTSAK